MTFDINMLDKNTTVKTNVPKKVFLPNGDVSHELHNENSSLSAGNNIKNVLHVP